MVQVNTIYLHIENDDCKSKHCTGARRERRLGMGEGLCNHPLTLIVALLKRDNRNTGFLLASYGFIGSPGGMRRSYF